MVEHGYIDVRDLRLHYATQGSGQPVVFLHGFPQYWYCWRHQMEALADRFQCLALDLRGYGESDKPYRGYDVATLADDVRGFLEALGIERAHIVGHDWGGVIAFRLGLHHPEVIDKLVVMNAPFRRVNFLRLWYAFVFNVPFLPELTLGWASDRFIRSVLRGASVDKKAFSEEDLRHYAEAFRRPGVHRASLAYYRSLWANRRIGRRDWGKKITCPTLIIWGDRDPALPFDLTRGMERDIPGVRIERVRDCGHFVQEERAEEVNRLLQKFL